MKSIVFLILLGFPFWVSSQVNNIPTGLPLQLNDSIHELGEIQISALKPEELLLKEQALRENHFNLAQSLELLPSVNFRFSGSRNESEVIIKGFGIQSVPVLLDGVPVYLPYDGSIDLSRFKMIDFSKVQVTTGMTPMSYGYNTLGGAINLITASPRKPIELSVSTGIESSKGYHAGIQMGIKRKYFYVQASYFHHQRDDYNLSKRYELISDEEDGGTRENSAFSDAQYSFKLGFTPNARDQYVLSYSALDGEKGVSPYAGDDPQMRSRYWQWPVWKKQHLYYLGETWLSSHTELKTRLSYDQFDNTLQAFDNSAYDSQEFPYAFTSVYDDYNFGGALILTNRSLENQEFTFSVHSKFDHHREFNEGELPRDFSDRSLSTGLDYTYKLSSSWELVSGASYQLRDGLRAEELDAAGSSIVSMETGSNAAWNAQLALRYRFSDQSHLEAFVARKSRFATMKERYSYKLGIALPNPDLKSERATHYELNYAFRSGKAFRLATSLYYIQLTDALLLVDQVFDGLGQMQNTGLSEFYGGDISVQWQAFSFMMMNANYSYIRRNNLSNPDIFFTDVPVHTLRAEVDFMLMDELRISFVSELQSEAYSTSYGTLNSAFQVYDLLLNYPFHPDFMLRTGVKNLFDANYSYVEGWPEQGRNWYMSLMYTFGRK